MRLTRLFRQTALMAALGLGCAAAMAQMKVGVIY